MAVLEGKKKRRSKDMSMEVTEESPKKNKSFVEENAVEKKKKKDKSFVIEEEPKQVVKTKKKAPDSDESDEELVSPKKKKKNSELTDFFTGKLDAAMNPSPSNDNKNEDVEGWSCGCGHSNLVSWKFCKKCRKANPSDRQRVWVCSKEGCEVSNFGPRSTCRKCDSSRDGSGATKLPSNLIGRSKDDWTCTGCGFSNFASRAKCKKCSARSGDLRRVEMSKLSYDVTEDDIKEFFSPLQTESVSVLTGGGKGKANVLFKSKEDARRAMGKDNTELNTRKVSLYLSRYSERKNITTPAQAATKTGHRVGLSHLSYDVTEDEIKRFFYPLIPVSVTVLTRGKGGRGLGKASVLFKSHQEAVKAMDKNQTDLNAWKVNMYLNSEPSDTDTTRAADTMNETADESMNDTSEFDTSSSGSPKKKFKWDKLIQLAVTNMSDDNSLSVKKLQKMLQPQYTQMTGEEIGVEEFREKLEQRLSKSLKVTYENGKVSL